MSKSYTNMLLTTIEARRFGVVGGWYRTHEVTALAGTKAYDVYVEGMSGDMEKVGTIVRCYGGCHTMGCPVCDRPAFVVVLSEYETCGETPVGPAAQACTECGAWGVECLCDIPF